MEKIKVSEKFYSLQGEGRFVGVPSVFLRTFGCNFTCAGFGLPHGERSTEADSVAKSVQLYSRLEDLPLVKTGCDSYASWHPKFKHLSPTHTVDELARELAGLVPGTQWVAANGTDTHLVITGGEPLLGWQRAYGELLDQAPMRTLRNITFETNGTQEITDALATYLECWQGREGREVTFSVSPKLAASGEKWAEAIKPEVIVGYADIGFVYLKFVVATQADFDEARRATAEYRGAGFSGPVYLMPVGGVAEVYGENRFNVAQAAMSEGWYYSPRLHLDLWKNAWGT